MQGWQVGLAIVARLLLDAFTGHGPAVAASRSDR
jgi:hypothetical protein